MRKKRISFLLFLILTFLLQPNAQSASQGYGPRAGFGSNPDQFVIGVQSVFGKTLKIARFAPSLDIGFGDGVKTYAFNADVRLLLFSPPKSSTAFYTVLGPTIVNWNFNQGNGDTEIGFTLGVGLRMPFGSSNFYNLETRFGMGDIPEFRLLFGILFGGNESSATSK